MQEHIAQIRARHDELEKLLQDPAVTQNPQQLKALSKEYNDLGRANVLAERLEKIDFDLFDIRKSLEEEADAEMAQLAKDEVVTLERQKAEVEEELRVLLTPPDPMDGKNVLMEIRPGAGGDEASLFAAQLLRMYTHFGEQHGIRADVIELSKTELGGVKEAIVELKGADAYKALKFESGVHRVQRVPETEKSGRVHTSTASVMILPEPEEIDVELKPEDLKIEATTSSGHGGQSVNTTYSAIRMTHIPTGIMVSCQDERSQKQNKEKAMQIMRARVYAYEMEKKRQADSAARKSQVGTGDRSEKIRTFNVPQDRVTDHRIKQNFSGVTAILDGNLQPIVDALQHAANAGA